MSLKKINLKIVYHYFKCLTLFDCQRATFLMGPTDRKCVSLEEPIAKTEDLLSGLEP